MGKRRSMKAKAPAGSMSGTMANVGRSATATAHAMSTLPVPQPPQEVLPPMKDHKEAALAMLRKHEEKGLTWAELSDHTGWHHGSTSSTLSSLHKAGQIERLTERRGKSSVYVLPEYVNGRDVAVKREPKKPVTCPNCGHVL